MKRALKSFTFGIYFLIATLCIASEKTDTIKTPSESIYLLDQNLKTQNNESIQLSHFKGQIVILAMIYTSCTGACPLTVNDIKKIENKLNDFEKKNIHIVLVSFDTEKDTPENLNTFAKKHALNSSRWTLVTGAEATTRQISAVLGIKYKKLGPSNFDHSNIISLLDKEGNIVFQQIGLNKQSDEMLKNIRALLK